MIEIIPAILPRNYEDLKNEISLVRGAVDLVQIDICDGIFTKNLTWPFLKASEVVSFDSHFEGIQNEEEGMPFWEDMNFELDLLVNDAVENFDIYSKMSPKSIIFHLEAVGDLKNFQDFLEGIDSYTKDFIQFGVALNPKTPLEDLFPLVSEIDFVQLMGNDKLGFHGVPLDEKVYERVKTLRGKFADLPIAVDIGVDRSTAGELVKVGATKLVIGSAIFNSEDIIGAIKDFRSLGN